MQSVSKWFSITLCTLFVLMLATAAGLYFVSDHQILVGLWGP
jgi:hypothetical protein